MEKPGRISWVEILSVVAGISATFIGTVVGAGFASGQEILQFFSKYGINGSFGVVLAIVIMGIATVKIFKIGSILQTESYRQFLTQIINPVAVTMADFFLFVFFLLLIGVMFAGCGAIFDELHLGYWWGLGLSGLIMIIVLYFDLSGLVMLNMIVIPMMFIAAVGISLFSIKTQIAPEPIINFKPGWLLASIQFSTYNLILALPVLLSLATRYSQRRVLVWGGWLGSICLGMMTGFIHWSILTHFSYLKQNALPMLCLAKNLGSWAYWGYAFILWGEMLTTLLANTYGLSKRMTDTTGISFFYGVILLTGVGMIIANFGFVNLVANVYPVFGYFSIILLMMIFAKPVHELKPIHKSKTVS